VNNLERFIARIPTLDPAKCWPYPGAQRPNGYRNANYQGKPTTGHRAVWLATGRTIPAGFDLDHLCRNRACCNPAHIEPVTRSENLRRGVCARLCQCDACVAKRDRPDRAARFAAAAAGACPVPHGHNGYSNYGCRCDVCRLGKSTYERTRKAVSA